MDRRAFAWALYDWANSAFPTMVSTFVIAAYFTQAVAPDPARGQAMWGWMQSSAAMAIALLSPILGAVADAGGRRRLLLGLCTLAAATLTALVWFARPDPSWTLWLLACVGGATVAFEVGTVFYNAMLPQVAPPGRIGRVSGLAWGLGYAGGLACLALALVLLIRPDPPLFGLDKASAEPVRAAALLTAAWLLGFGWPVLLAVPDPVPGPGQVRPGWAAAARGGLEELVSVLRRLPRRRELWRFLLANMLYTDGLNTLFAFGAIFAAGVHGMAIQEILLFGIALNVTAGIGAAAGGLLDDRLGSKRTVLFSLLALLLLSAALVVVASKTVFWGLALLLGLFFGPVQASSRTLLARLAPPGEMAAHFGLFALSGRITGFLGPAVLAAVTAASGSQRLGMATIGIFLAAGALVLLTVRAPRRTGW
ncbi:MFS transporter [Roseomonas gilardii subsp. gilardii]|uniref:MFS transporter n=1 Tax=Roseomonas gilardii TaxID=257708 RepID=UPI001FF950D3|nr:MFS transporter [Roseomonas gilardii]UPG72723.1 MFS transporter [Roseomonas gilardii subsp. gilardii]